MPAITESLLMTLPSQNTVTVILPVICFLFLALIGARHGLKSSHRGQGPPVVPSRLPFGLDILLAALNHFRHDTFFDWVRSILNVPGHTVELRLLGTRLIMTDDSDNIKALMSTQFSEFGKGHLMHQIFDTVLGDSIFATDGPAWLASKDHLRPHVAKIRGTDCDDIERHVVNLLQSLPPNDGPFELYDLIDRFQLDVVTDIFLGESANCLLDRRQPFRSALDHLTRYNSIRVLFGPLGLLAPDRIFARQSVRQMDQYMDTHVNRARSLSAAEISAKAEKDHTLMDSMAVRNLDAKIIKNHLVTVLMAAKDPVAILLTWILYECARQPDIVRELRAEIASAVGDSQPTVTQVQSMKYMQNMIREAMRLYHPVGFNVRCAEIDTKLPRGGGALGQDPIRIPAGTQISYSVLSLHRRPDLLGPTADMFDPHRWDEWKPPLWEFIPFNHGPRICLGRNFGQFQLGYTLVRLFQAFEAVELIGLGRDSEERQGGQKIKIEMNTKMSKEIWVVFRKGRGKMDE